MTRTGFTRAQEAEFKKMWLDLVELPDICDHFGISKNGARSIRDELGLKARTQADRNRIRARREEQRKEKAQADADTCEVVVGCSRCGWESGLVTLAVGREQFAGHRCSGAVAA